MARRGKPQGNKRQREQAKARKKREKEARKLSRKGGPLDEGVELDEDGFPILPEEPDLEGAAEGEDAPDGDPDAETAALDGDRPAADAPPQV